MYHAKKYREIMPFFGVLRGEQDPENGLGFFIFLLSKTPCLWQLHGSLWRLAWAG